MKFLKSHFWYNKRQRNGILFLIILICLLQIALFFADFSVRDVSSEKTTELVALQQQIDRLKQLEITNRTPKIFPFNPNYLTDFKASRLGMSTREIDRLFEYRKSNKFINSATEFQQITKISDSLVSAISPYFKFPDWVSKRHKNNSKNKKTTSSVAKRSTIDMNVATIQDFTTVKGVSKTIAKRIVKYRTKLQGFSIQSQLSEVWGLDTTTTVRILATFSVISNPKIDKININTATFKEVLKNPYIDYDLCKKIFEYRDQVAELQSLKELKNISNFPIEKYNRIALYLFAE